MSVETVFYCLGETDEAHPFCPFATRDKTKADDHDKLAGHWTVEGTEVPGGLWAEVLAAEDKGASRS